MTIEGLWLHFDRSGGADSCWEWTGLRLPTGYGWFKERKRTIYAHRRSYEIAVGPIPDGMNVLHRCDNPPCCRPDHLFLGTQADNVADMIRKGRSALGAKNGTHTHPESRPRGDRHWARKYPERVLRGARLPQTRLNAAMVREIRALYEAGSLSQKTIAQQFGVCQGTVSFLVRRETWAWVP